MRYTRVIYDIGRFYLKVLFLTRYLCTSNMHQVILPHFPFVSASTSLFSTESLLGDIQVNVYRVIVASASQPKPLS